MIIEELLGHLSPDRFLPNLAAETKDEVLAQLTDAVIAGSPIKDRALLLEMLRNREQLGSTALEKGVAFPHGRSLAVSKLTILIARSADGVDFDSEDGKSTHLFFLLLAPPQDSGNMYLQSLGKIAELVRKDSTRRALLAAADFDSFVQVMRENA